MKSPADRTRAEAAGLASLLPPLLAEARKVAASAQAGVHGRRRSGPGDAFWQFRRYQPGDPADEIDWRQSAKSAHLFVREKEWEAPDRVRIWVDPSASMHWRSDAALPEKRERALVLALALGYLLAEGGETAQPLASAWDGRAPDVERLGAALADLPEAGGWPAPPERRQDRIVLFSDFLLAGDELDEKLGAFVGRTGRVHLVQVLDPAELVFPYQGRVRFSGLEGETDLTVPKAEDLREAFAGRMAALRTRLQSRARASDWSFAFQTTDQPAVTALSMLHSAIRGT